MDWQGKVAFITGGVSGIGFGLARAFSNAGMRLALSYRNEAYRDQAAKWFADNGREAPLFVHLDVTDHPTADWTSQQLLEAFGDGRMPRFLIRDRDAVYGSTFRERVKTLGIEEVVIAPRSPWQTPYVERVIGSMRRECLDHVVVLGESHLRRIVKRYVRHHHASRCHLALEKDAPQRGAVLPPEQGHVIEIPEVGGLHHRYERPAA